MKPILFNTEMIKSILEEYRQRRKCIRMTPCNRRMEALWQRRGKKANRKYYKGLMKDTLKWTWRYFKKYVRGSISE